MCNLDTVFSDLETIDLLKSKLNDLYREYISKYK
jgi:hypothetical protein